MNYTLTAIAQIHELIERGAIFYISHSGGKDSQAMFILVTALVPADQIVVVHSDLGAVEHHGGQDHIRATIGDFELHVVCAGKDFFDMVERRHETRPDVCPFPSSATRQCTSDLKRDPIYKFIRHDMKARDSLLAVNVMGLRAGESPARAKKNPLAHNARLSKAGREIYDWLPIHDLNCVLDLRFDPETMEDDIFNVISAADQKAFWMYATGNQRMSCVFCIMASANDIQNGARHRPELFERLVNLEKSTGWTMFNGETLEERAGMTVAEAYELNRTMIPVNEVA
jgi:3'-phosphoadenosine 5'-phosphosulfate sulfotransferase (PAPS reductase)/FAD synthetase